jgi:uncharacterized RDD family membrane protein YckC
MLNQVRLVARSPRVGGVARSGVESVAAAAASALETEAERAVDGVLAGPMPEAVARSLIERRVVGRIVNEVLTDGALEEMIASATADARTERLLQQVLASPAVEQLLVDALDSQLTLELTDRLLRNPELQHVIEDAVREALASQTTTLADTMAASARRLDTTLEAGPRRWLRRPPRPQALPSGEPAVPYAGLGSRTAALLVDGFLVHAGYLVGCAMFVLAIRLVDWNSPHWLDTTLAGVGWTAAVATYFVAFWTAAGQTPGMRLLRLRVQDARGAPPRAWRSLLRLLGSAVAITFVFLGFVPVLIDNRRRALQDFLARTLVVYQHLLPPATEPVNAASTPLLDHDTTSG